MMVFGVILDFATAALIIAVINAFALRSWRRSKGAHWTERARLLYPVRMNARLNILGVPLLLIVAHPMVSPHTAPHWLSTLLVGWLGALFGTYPVDRETVPWIRWVAWMREVTLGRVLFLGNILVLGGVFLVMPKELNHEALLVLALAVALEAWYVWGGLLRCLKWLRLIEPAPDRVQSIIRGLATSMGMKMPSVWMLQSSSCNAFALPHTYALLFTHRCVTQLPDDELEAVGRHEMGHLQESALTRWLRFGATMFFVPWLMLKPLYFEQLWAWAVVFFLMPLLLLVVVTRLGKRWERQADQVAMDHETDEGTYAGALARLYEDNQLPAVMPGRNNVHPHLYDRLLAAGVQPDFSRPKPPPNFGWSGLLVWTALFMLLLNHVKELPDSLRLIPSQWKGEAVAAETSPDP